MAGCAIAVHGGSFIDPFDLQGLSHYVEHVLFMGNEVFALNFV